MMKGLPFILVCQFNFMTFLDEFYFNQKLRNLNDMTICSLTLLKLNNNGEWSESLLTKCFISMTGIFCILWLHNTLSNLLKMQSSSIYLVHHAYLLPWKTLSSKLEMIILWLYYLVSAIVTSNSLCFSTSVFITLKSPPTSHEFRITLDIYHKDSYNVNNLFWVHILI